MLLFFLNLFIVTPNLIKKRNVKGVTFMKYEGLESIYKSFLFFINSLSILVSALFSILET